MDVAQFFKSLSNLTMEAKYRAQDDYIIHFLEQIKTERKKMQINSEGCAQMAQSKMSGSRALADEADGLAELAKLSNIVASLLGELRGTVEKAWKVVSTKSFNTRMSTIEDPQADFNNILEVRRQGVKAVAKKTNSHPAEDSHRKWIAIHNENLAKDPRFYGGYVPKEGE
jgi:hypothetical protein